MTTASRERFVNAYDAWRDQPVQRVDTIPTLSIISNELIGIQVDIEPILSKYRADQEPTTERFPRWNQANTWIIGQAVNQLRVHQQSGRNQIATRELLAQGEALKQVWSAYRNATGQ